jgi:hypothetical protein
VDQQEQAVTKKRKPKAGSILDWMAGDNQPDALGYVAIDPARWAAVEKILREVRAKEDRERNEKSRRAS